jgi:CHASE1-domain containing sensor protein
MSLWFTVGLWLGLGLIAALGFAGLGLWIVTALYLWGQEHQQRKLEREAKYEMARWEGTE